MFFRFSLCKVIADCLNFLLCIFFFCPTLVQTHEVTLNKID